MRSRKSARMRRAVVAEALVATLASLAFTSAAHSKRPFTVSDGIEMARFGNLVSSEPQDDSADQAFSPDRRHYVFLTNRGSLASGKLESTLWVYDTRDVESFLQMESSRTELRPRKLVSVQTIATPHA